MLFRKNVGNPSDFFEKTFEEYRRGFAANGLFVLYFPPDAPQGEVWLGLERLRCLTAGFSPYSLHVTMGDWDGTEYTAVFEEFQVAVCLTTGRSGLGKTTPSPSGSSARPNPPSAPAPPSIAAADSPPGHSQQC